VLLCELVLKIYEMDGMLMICCVTVILG
jgi:hypothetical protein